MRRISRIVKSDEEIRLEAETPEEADKQLAERQAARDEAQAAYDTQPPMRPYQRQE